MTSRISQVLLFEHVDLMTMDAQNLQALEAAREASWRVGIVTNGATAQQSRKIDLLGLEEYADAIVISEEVGVSKPEREIFQIAAQRLDTDLDDGWMVGDHPIADILGGRNAGCGRVGFRVALSGPVMTPSRRLPA
ncbi:HAD family hydrolase [Paenarthrobacter sp. NPDC090520]|uniref:HAD family hydrolase n=1 Tax=Paenarthrobacter sp. NPDC090520 TaxID=3364382 RepID=UPI0038231EE6